MKNQSHKAAAHYDEAIGGLAIFLGAIIAFTVLMFLIGTTSLEIALDGDGAPGQLVTAKN